jgi:hypothetical protein|mmetsp:Transcript_6771/g.10855  ORF Transcript_6771/g.10855 Transcript_6771/m.10855 type:complete len:318 (+) Transcript_6771:128-1081(+)
MAEKLEVGVGFALDEYLVPLCELPPRVKGGTMAKAAAGAGGLFAEMSKNAGAAPGPGHYGKELNERNFVKEARGGTFSKLARDWGKHIQKAPAVGQYETKTTHRVRGGLMSKTNRVCAFARIAEKISAWNSNGPGKYEPRVPQKHSHCPSFSRATTESRNGKKVSAIGPGHYNPSYQLVEHHVPCYSGTKEETGQFLARMLGKDKDKNPFPCYKDMPDSKVHDKIGKRLHCNSLIRDRDVPPRIYPPAITSRRRETTPRAATAPHSARAAGTPRAASAPGSARGVVSSARGNLAGRETPMATTDTAVAQTAIQAGDI